MRRRLYELLPLLDCHRPILEKMSKLRENNPTERRRNMAGKRLTKKEKKERAEALELMKKRFEESPAQAAMIAAAGEVLKKFPKNTFGPAWYL